jgi:hypothetical protein
MRRHLMHCFGALILALALFAPAHTHAGGWSVVALDAMPTDIQAGVPFEVGFTVLQHGRTPLAGLKPEITLINKAAGEQVSVIAKEQGKVGHYIATLNLPVAGEWSWEVNAFGSPQQMVALQITTTPAFSAVQMPTAVLQIALLAAGALMLIALSGMAIRRWQRQGSAT